MKVFRRGRSPLNRPLPPRALESLNLPMHTAIFRFEYLSFLFSFWTALSNKMTTLIKKIKLKSKILKLLFSRLTSMKCRGGTLYIGCSHCLSNCLRPCRGFILKSSRSRLSLTKTEGKTENEGGCYIFNIQREDKC